MVQQLSSEQQPSEKQLSDRQPEKQPVIYPESDGQPMADNTKQFRWIVTIKENLERLFAADAMVFVAGDLLWYPVEGNNAICQAPDAMVAFGRPKGDRGSYQQWREEGIAPQVVFEILSPSNRLKEMSKKLKFYEQYGVEEYYIYDPDGIDFAGWLRTGNAFEVIEDPSDWVSPRLGIRFVLQPDTLEIYRPDGDRFLTHVELGQLWEQERQRAETAIAQLEQERLQRQQEQERYQALLNHLRQQGIEPPTLE
ncbi:MAG: Uma2 family endonuclease [Leptolyngbyaceae cyanobacterium SM1_4_3]|nr:Uma2 family endonuclease [Leptolyngbyaceae cyanobacterium SM1_4_3]